MRRELTIFISILLFAQLALVSMVPQETGADSLGNFGTGVSEGLPTDGDYNALATGKVNADEHLDIAFGGEDYGGADTTGLYVFLGNSEGTWTEASTGLPTVDSWGGTAFGDADGDGKMELYACNDGWGSHSGAVQGLGAWEYDSDSWSQTGISSPHTTRTTNDLRLLDFTKGAGLDIALTTSTGGDGGIRVYYGSGSDPITWTDNSIGLPTSGEYAAIDVLDLNDDGLMDIASVGYGAKGLHIFTQNDGGNGWTDRSSTLPSNAKDGRMLAVAMGDLNNDDNTDIVYGKSDNGGLLVLLGNGGGSPGGTDFSWVEAEDGLPSSARSGRFAQTQFQDIDQDGDLDILSAKSNSGLRLYLGNGSEEPGDDLTFTEVTDKGLPTSGTHYGAMFFDFDDDDDLDLAGATWGSGVTVYETVFSTENNVPVADAGDGQEVLTGEEVTLDGSGSEDAEDGDNIEFQWRVDEGNPETVTLSDTTAEKPAFTAPNTPGDYAFYLKVKDTDDQWSEEDDVTVKVGNRKPVANAGENITVHTGEEVTLDGSGSSDPEDGEDILYEWSEGKDNPEEVSLSDPAGEKPAFTAPDLPGDYLFILKVKDTHDEESEPSEVTVHVLNRRPVADAGSDLTRTEDTKVILNGSRSSDPDGTIDHYNWTCTSHSVTLEDADSAEPNFTPEEPGDYVFTLGVQDDQGVWSEKEDTVNLTVVEKGENLAPTADAGPGQAVIKGEKVTLDGSGSEDPDGEIAVWQWNCTSHGSLNLNNDDTASPSFTPGEVTTYSFTLRVKDDNGSWSSEDSVDIEVEAAPEKPIANAGDDFTVTLGGEVTLDGSGSEDPDGYIVSHDWACISHELDLEYPGSLASPKFTPEEEGEYVFTLIVEDNDELLSEKDYITVTVTAPKENSAPVVEITSPAEGDNLSGLVTVSWTAADPEGDTMTFTLEYSSDSGTSFSVIRSDIASPTKLEWDWNTNSTAVPNGKSYRLRLTAKDGNATGSKTCVFETGDFTVYNAPDDGGDPPKEEEEEESGFLPGFGLALLILAFTLGALWQRPGRRS